MGGVVLTGWADLVPPFTIEAWYRLDGTPNDATNPWYGILVKPGAYGVLQRGNVGGAFPAMHFDYSNRGSTDNDTGWAATVGTVYHAVIVLRSGGTLLLYINGTLVATLTGIAAPGISANAIFIGRDDAGGTNEDWFDGLIDEVALYNYELPAARVSVHAAGGASYQTNVLADNPLGYWGLDETSGMSAADLTGHGHAGTYSGSVTQGNVSLVPGYGGHSAGFPGTSRAGVMIPDTTGGWGVGFARMGA